MIIEGDENLNQEDIQVPALFDQYIDLLFKYIGTVDGNDCAMYHAMLREDSNLDRCIVTFDSKWLDSKRRILSFRELVEIPGAEFEIYDVRVIRWSR